MIVLSNYSRERYTKAHESGKLQLSSTEIYDFTSEDLCDLGEIGRGAFGSVNKMIFKKTDKVMAVKVKSFKKFLIEFLMNETFFREFDVQALLMKRSRKE